MHPRSEMSLLTQKSARGKPPAEENCEKHQKIGLKRVAVGAFWTSPGPKCTEKQDLQPRNGDIAPKPLK